VTLVIETGGKFSESEINAANYVKNLGENTSNVKQILSRMASKNSQTTGIVLDLSQTTVNAVDLGNALARVRGIVSAGGKIPNINDIIIMPK